MAEIPLRIRGNRRNDRKIIKFSQLYKLTEQGLTFLTVVLLKYAVKSEVPSCTVNERIQFRETFVITLNTKT